MRQIEGAKVIFSENSLFFIDRVKIHFVVRHPKILYEIEALCVQV